MGEVIGPNAKLSRVADHVRRTLITAVARGGEIGKAAEDRLSEAVAKIDAATAMQRTAQEAEAKAWAAVLAEDARSDSAILALRETMWNVLGRPRAGYEMDEVFPGGASVYTAVDPRKQPVLMQILQSRILSSSASRWTEAMRKEWAAQVVALRAPFEAALAAHRPAEAATTVADFSYRSAVRTAHARLRIYKRDLMNIGMTDAQIHEIIPDASATTSGAAARRPNDEGPRPGSGAPAPGTSSATGTGHAGGAGGPANANGSAGVNGAGSVAA